MAWCRMALNLSLKKPYIVGPASRLLQESSEHRSGREEEINKRNNEILDNEICPRCNTIPNHSGRGSMQSSCFPEGASSHSKPCRTHRIETRISYPHGSQLFLSVFPFEWKTVSMSDSSPSLLPSYLTENSIDIFPPSCQSSPPTLRSTTLHYPTLQPISARYPPTIAFRPTTITISKSTHHPLATSSTHCRSIP